MSVPFLNLQRQYEKLQDEIEPKVIEVLRSGAYIGGKYVAQFESEMQEYLRVKHVVSCANGTDALMLALRACGVAAGDEVITTPFSFFATAEAIAAIGATPVFVDVREADMNIDPSKIEAAISPRAKVILPVHIFGRPCDMDEINAIASKHDLKVVEDAAQAIGCEYKGKKIGVAYNMATFSFYPTKNLGAFGDAGMVTTDNDDFAVTLRALREHGMGKDKYFNYMVAYNSRLDAVQAAILSIKLKHLDEYNEKRKQIALAYEKGLHGVVKIPAAPINGISCYHQYAIRTEKKEELGNFLNKQGIGFGAFYPVPLHLQKAFDYLGYKAGDLPIAEMLCRQTVCLPIFPELTAEEVSAVISAIKAFAGVE
jgi:dTDP-4-amino-4,6-dideoxygalactose transaminase